MIALIIGGGRKRRGRNSIFLPEKEKRPGSAPTERRKKKEEGLADRAFPPLRGALGEGKNHHKCTSISGASL